MITEEGIIVEEPKTEAQLTKEKTEDYLSGLVTEKGYYETRLEQLKAMETVTARDKEFKDSELARVSADLEAVKAELARVGESSAPTSRVRK